MGLPGPSFLALSHTETNSRENCILKKKTAIQHEILLKLHPKPIYGTECNDEFKSKRFDSDSAMKNIFNASTFRKTKK